MIPHLLRYQGLAVDDYGFVLDALDWGILNFRSIRVLIRKSLITHVLPHREFSHPLPFEH
jgi:hypothetical protein